MDADQVSDDDDDDDQMATPSPLVWLSEAYFRLQGGYVTDPPYPLASQDEDFLMRSW